MPAKADNFMLVDQNLQSHELHRLSDASAVVLITHGNGCPIVRNIGPAIKALQAKYAGKNVEFLMLNSNLQDTREAVAAEAKEYGFDIPIMMDDKQLVGEQLGVTRTAEVFVIDPKTWKVAYRGPIDDRVTFERQKAKADNHFAADAIDAVMAGQSVKVASRQSAGCLIDFPERARLAEHAKISYATTSRRSSRRSAWPATSRAGSGPSR
jgi:peroxiredoxin